MLLAGKVAVVTGAGRGLGRAYALALAARGASVLVNDIGADLAGDGRDVDVARQVVTEITDTGATAVADHTDIGSIRGGEAVVDACLAAFRRVDVVVNNAGVSRSVPITELDTENLERHLAVHLEATVGTTKAAFAAMGDGGSIVNVVSGAGLDPQWPNTAAYACAKAAVYAFTRVAAIEGAARGIRVNAVSPLARTRMSENFSFGSRLESGDLLDPARVSQMVVFLASRLSDGITGRVLRAGGRDVGEVRFATLTSASEDYWTPELLAERVDDFIART